MAKIQKLKTTKKVRAGLDLSVVSLDKLSITQLYSVLAQEQGKIQQLEGELKEVIQDVQTVAEFYDVKAFDVELDVENYSQKQALINAIERARERQTELKSQISAIKLGGTGFIQAIKTSELFTETKAVAILRNLGYTDEEILEILRENVLTNDEDYDQIKYDAYQWQVGKEDAYYEENQNALQDLLQDNSTIDLTDSQNFY